MNEGEWIVGIDPAGADGITTVCIGRVRNGVMLIESLYRLGNTTDEVTIRNLAGEVVWTNAQNP